MRHRLGRLFSLIGVALAGLFLAICLTALAEATSPAPQACAPVKGEEINPSKTSPPTLWAVLAEHNVLPPELPLSECFLLDPTPDFVSANLWGDLSSRAPPALL